MTPEELIISEIGRLLPTVAPLPTRLAASDLYEAFLFGIVVAAARDEGATVNFLDSDERSVTQLTFRTSPGYISSKAQKYTHARLDFPRKPPLEAHIGVRVAGNSRVAHECDVSVLRRSEAARCRQSGPIPRASQLILALEAKFYTAHLSLGLARGFLGLRSDLGARDARFVANISSSSVAGLLSKKAPANWHDRVVPGSTDKLTGALRQTFTNYRSRR